MFSGRLLELRQRQLTMRLRGIELRAQIRSDITSIRLPGLGLGLGAGAGLLGLVGVVAATAARRRSALGWLALALRVVRLWQSQRAE